MRTASIVLLLATTACGDFAPGPAIISITPTQPTTVDDLKVSIDKEAYDPEGGSLTYRYDWYRDGTLWSDNGSNTVLAEHTAKSEIWRAEVKTHDGNSAGASMGAEITILNTAPTVSLSVEPDDPETDDDIVVTATTQDVDEDTVTLDWSWTRDGQPTGHSDGTIPAVDTLRWQTWIATVVPHDGEIEGDPVSTTILVDNAAPEITSISLTPEEAYEDTVMRVEVGYQDADSEAVTVSYAWYTDDTLVLEGSATTITGAYFDKHQDLHVVVTPSDAYDQGEPTTSDTVTILNSPPTLDSVSIDPGALYEGSTATCVGEGLEDEDGDSFTNSYAWYVGGSLVSTEESIDGSSFDRGDEVSCTMTANDGEEDGPSGSSETLTVLNTPPAISSVTLSPTTPVEGDTVTATISGGTDEDGDGISYTYAWYVDGAWVSSDSQLGSDNFDKHDTISATVTPTDDYGSGTAVSSATVTVANSPPVFTALTTSPEDAVWNESISAAPSGWSDADGDSEDYDYQWTVDGSSAGSSVSLSLSGYDRGAEVQVEVTAWDGEDSGTTITSDPLSILQLLDAPDADGMLLGDSAEQVAHVVLLSPDILGGSSPTLVVGAPESDATAPTAGAVYLYSGWASGTVNLQNDADAVLWGDDANDEAGRSVSWAGDVDDDGWDDLLVGAPGDATFASDAGVAFLVPGPIAGQQDLSAMGYALYGRSSGDLVGYSVAGVEDMDGDGFDDVLVGAYGADSEAGVVYLTHGPISGSNYIDSADTIELTGAVAGDSAGSAVAAPGDVNGDGQPDLLVGAQAESSAGTDTGAAYLLYGPVSTSAGLDSSSDGMLTGENDWDYAGYTVAGAGDVNDDGLADVLVGSRWQDAGGSGSGAAYLVLGPSSGTASLSTAEAKLVGGGSSELAGSSLTSLGDIDGDDHDDIAIGAPGRTEAGTNTGAVYVLLGPLSGTLDLSDSVYCRIDGDTAGDKLGTSVSGGQDVDNDGTPDLLIGAPFQDDGGTSAGAAYLFDGGNL